MLKVGDYTSRTNKIVHIANGVATLMNTTQKTYFKVSEEDLPKLKSLGQSFMVDKKGYVQTTIRVGDAKMGLQLHVFVLDRFKVEDGLCIDHKNGVKTDCTRQNLVVSTRRDNSLNPVTKAKAGLKFIGLLKQRGRYAVYITVDGKQKYFGSCSSAEEAAVMYDKEISKFYPGTTRTNYSLGNFDKQWLDEHGVHSFEDLLKLPIAFDNRKVTNKYKGVSFVTDRAKYCAYLYLNGKSKKIGQFATEYEAVLFREACIERFSLSDVKNGINTEDIVNYPKIQQKVLSMNLP